MSAWVLPDHIADVLPSEARHIEDLRRRLLDTARCYGYELIAPPLVEHLESLLTGTGEALELQTFKLVDQLSGRTLGVRADTTPQAARIDAHLLNRTCVTRLCYCGPVLHTRPDKPHATREPLQFGAEIFGHADLQADLESLQLALDCLGAAGVEHPLVDLGDARIVKSLLVGTGVDPAAVAQVHAALAAKDRVALAKASGDLTPPVREALSALVDLYGDRSVLEYARGVLAAFPAALHSLDQLAWLAQALGDTDVSFDLADSRGYAYYSGVRFAIFAPRASDALVRGGRYDEVGAVFGRKRPAVGFSLDVKALAGVVARPALRAAVRAAWSERPDWRRAVAQLRQGGETVVCVMPGHESEVDEFLCDRELVHSAGQWILQRI